MIKGNHLTSILVVVMVFMMAGVASAQVPSRLHHIQENGIIRIGTRPSAAPFSHVDMNGVFQGFSVDIGKMIAAGLSKSLGVKITPEFLPVTAQNRFDKVTSGEVDMVCGLTTMTWDREKRVDFSLPIFVDGTRILVRRSGRYNSLESLRGKVIGVAANTTTVQIVAKSVPGVVIKEFPRLDDALEEFANGEIYGVANIGVFLAAARAEMGGALTMELIPSHYSLTTEIIGCVLPPDDSAFRDQINKILFDAFKGIENYLGAYSEIYFHWFGVDSDIRFPMTNAHKELLKVSRIWLE